MVEFQTKFDEDTIKSLSKHMIKKTLGFMFLIIITFVLLGVLCFFSNVKEVGVFLIAFGVLFGPIYLVLMKTSQKKTSKSLTILGETTIEIYQFYEDKMNIITTKGEEYKATVEAKYSYFLKVEETQEDYFLWISNTQTHIVHKKDLVQGSFEELNEIFSQQLKGRFKHL